MNGIGRGSGGRDRRTLREIWRDWSWDERLWAIAFVVAFAFITIAVLDLISLMKG